MTPIETTLAVLLVGGAATWPILMMRPSGGHSPMVALAGAAIATLILCAPVAVAAGLVHWLLF